MIKEFLRKYKSSILKTLLIVVILATMGGLGYLILYLTGFTDQAKFEALRAELGDSFLFWFIIALLQIFQVIFIPISNQIITVPLALLFPTDELWKVFLCSWLSIWFATLILYFIGKWGGEKLLAWVLKDKEQTEKCRNWLNKGWFFYPAGMLLPLPDDIITILAGTSGFKFYFVAICSFFTRAIDVACSVWGWGYLTRYWWGWIVLAVGIILLGLITFIFYKWQKKGKKI